MAGHRKHSQGQAAEAPRGGSVFDAPRLWTVAGAACIVAAALVIYWPSIHGGFLLDDALLLTGSRIIAAPDGLYRFWCTTEPVDYWPVTNSSFWIEWRLWGADPTGYHVTNLVLHVAACLLLWRILRRLSIPGAFLAAVLFAVHPVNVESVAWISQRKNVLAMVFFLLSALWYFRSDEESPPAEYKLCRPEVGGWYGLGLLAFVLAMLSKGSVAMLPVLLLVIVWWRRGLTRWDFLRTSPFFLAAVVLSGVNVWFQSHHGEEAVRHASFLERMLGAGAAVWFYLEKAVFPLDLAFVYPQWNIRPADPRWWPPLAAVAAVTLVLWWYRRGWGRVVLAAWLFFGAALVPVLGFVDVGFMKYSLVADHYLHVAILAVVALAAVGWTVWYGRAQGGLRVVAGAVALGLVGTLASLTWHQNGLYRDALTLYEAAEKKNPNCSLVETNLGNEHFGRNRLSEAIQHYRRAIELEPDSFEAHHNLGVALRGAGQLPEAIQEYQRALDLQPESPEVFNDVGVALEQSGRLDEAIEKYQKALRIVRDYPEAINNLGNVYSKLGRKREAIEQYEEALRIRPDYTDALYNLGNEYLAARQFGRAIEYYKRAVDARPGYVEAHTNLGNALAQSGRLQEAIHHFERAVRLAPKSPDIHYNLGKAYCDLGDLPQAAAHYQTVLRLQPDCAEAYLGLAETYAKAGRGSEAVAAARKSLALAKAAGRTPLAKTIDQWLKSYEAAQE
jgi:protein O-mannosyl-transferase